MVTARICAPVEAGEGAGGSASRRGRWSPRSYCASETMRARRACALERRWRGEAMGTTPTTPTSPTLESCSPSLPPRSRHGSPRSPVPLPFEWESIRPHVSIRETCVDGKPMNKNRGGRGPVFHHKVKLPMGAHLNCGAGQGELTLLPPLG